MDERDIIAITRRVEALEAAVAELRAQDRRGALAGVLEVLNAEAAAPRGYEAPGGCEPTPDEAPMCDGAAPDDGEE